MRLVRFAISFIFILLESRLELLCFVILRISDISIGYFYAGVDSTVPEEYGRDVQVVLCCDWLKRNS